MKLTRFFSNFSVFQLAMANLLLCSALLYTACQKDTSTSEQAMVYASKTSLQEVKRAFESGQLGTLALRATPVFAQSIERNEGGTTFLLTPVEGMGTETTDKKGINLVFFKDLKGKIQHFAAIWRTNADASYPSQWAPSKGDVAFSGDLTWINAQDVVLSATKFDKGQAQYILPVQQKLSALMASVLPSNATQDRGPGSPNLTSWNEIQQYWAAIDKLYHDMFGGGATGLPSTGLNVTSTTDPAYQYGIFLSTCSMITAWVVAAEQSLETHPYERVDYRLCQLIEDLTPYTNGSNILYCLWKNYSGTRLLESILQTWNQGDKSAQAARLMIATLEVNLNCQ